MKKTRTPELSWTQADYRNHGMDPPAELDDDTVTEGILMDEDEVEEWFLDSIKVLRILGETEPAAFESLYPCFVLDVKYLYGLGKITEDAVAYASDRENLKWQ